MLLQRTTSKSHIGELAPIALCDIHVAGCGEHLPAWGLCDDRRVHGSARSILKGGGVASIHIPHLLTPPILKLKSPPPPRQSKSPREERLLDQAQARASYTPIFWGRSRSILHCMVFEV